MTAGETYASWDDRDAPYREQRGSSLASTGSGRRLWTTEPSLASWKRSESWWGRTMRRRKDMSILQETVLFLAVAFFLAVLVRTFLFQAFYIPFGSMESTLNVGDRILVNKMVYDVRQPRRGEIVIFRGTSSWAPEIAPDTDTSFFSRIGSGIGDLVGISKPTPADFVKRIIGLPGDTVACCDVDGHVTVNGQPLIEPYVTGDAPLDSPKGAPPCSTRPFEPVVVRPGNMFVMGDDRIISYDSRCQGQVPMVNIIGRAIAIVWSPSRWTSLSVPSTFADVPKPYTLGTAGLVPVYGSRADGNRGDGIWGGGIWGGGTGGGGIRGDGISRDGGAGPGTSGGVAGLPGILALGLAARTLRRRCGLRASSTT